MSAYRCSKFDIVKFFRLGRFSSTGITESLLLALELGNNPNLNDFADIRLLYRLQYLNIGGYAVFCKLKCYRISLNVKKCMENY